MGIKTAITKVFNEKFGYPASYLARAPGRVNLLGEHMDYNDGFVLPTAIDRASSRNLYLPRLSRSRPSIDLSSMFILLILIVSINQS